MHTVTHTHPLTFDFFLIFSNFGEDTGTSLAQRRVTFHAFCILFSFHSETLPKVCVPWEVAAPLDPANFPLPHGNCPDRLVLASPSSRSSK